MTVDVTTEIEINRPIEAVASFASDPDNVMLWYKNIHTVEWQTERPLKLGSKVAFVAKFMVANCPTPMSLLISGLTRV